MATIERYTVLAHKFEKLTDACDYLILLSINNKCAILPTLRCWIGGKVVKEYELEVTLEEYKFVEVKRSEYEQFKIDIQVDKLLKLEEDEEKEDGDGVFFKHFNDRFYAVGHSAYQVNIACNIDLETGKDGLIYLSFSEEEYENVVHKIEAEGWCVGCIGDYKS